MRQQKRLTIYCGRELSLRRLRHKVRVQNSTVQTDVRLSVKKCSFGKQNEGHYVVPITKCLFDPKYGRRLSIHLSARP